MQNAAMKTPEVVRGKLAMRDNANHGRHAVIIACWLPILRSVPRLPYQLRHKSIDTCRRKGASMPKLTVCNGPGTVELTQD